MIKTQNFFIISVITVRPIKTNGTTINVCCRVSTLAYNESLFVFIYIFCAPVLSTRLSSRRPSVLIVRSNRTEEWILNSYASNWNNIPWSGAVTATTFLLLLLVPTDCLTNWLACLRCRCRRVYANRTLFIYRKLCVRNVHVARMDMDMAAILTYYLLCGVSQPPSSSSSSTSYTILFVGFIMY